MNPNLILRGSLELYISAHSISDTSPLRRVSHEDTEAASCFYGAHDSIICRDSILVVRKEQTQFNYLRIMTTFIMSTFEVCSALVTTINKMSHGRIDEIIYYIFLLEEIFSTEAFEAISFFSPETPSIPWHCSFSARDSILRVSMFSGFIVLLDFQFIADTLELSVRFGVVSKLTFRLSNGLKGPAAN